MVQPVIVSQVEHGIKGFLKRLEKTSLRIQDAADSM